MGDRFAQFRSFGSSSSDLGPVAVWACATRLPGRGQDQQKPVKDPFRAAVALIILRRWPGPWASSSPYAPGGGLAALALQPAGLAVTTGCRAAPCPARRYRHAESRGAAIALALNSNLLVLHHAGDYPAIYRCNVPAATLLNGWVSHGRRALRCP